MAALVTIFVEPHGKRYRRTKNPVHLWLAYKVARKLNAPLPPWLLDYFDECAARLTDGDGTRSPKAIAAALGLETKGGGPSALSRAKTELKHSRIVTDVAWRVEAAVAKGGNVLLEPIWAEVAALRGVSTETVRDRWYARLPPRRRARKLSKPGK